MKDSDLNTKGKIGYQEAYNLVKTHYENFPVVSLLIPKELRKHVAIVYWFARTADDFADEGNFKELIRISNLTAFEDRLNFLIVNEPRDNFEVALKNTIISKNLSPNNFFNLLKAFKQDVNKNRYANFSEVLKYCSYSANPVGRIMLELFNIKNDKAFNVSDKICTALQLTNFIQDTKIDFRKNRIYYPQDEMKRFGVDEKMFEMTEINLNLKQLVEFNVNRTQTFYNEGKDLLEFLSGRFKYEISWTIRGGEEILNKIRDADFDVFTKRPVLTKSDHIKILTKSLIHL